MTARTWWVTVGTWIGWKLARRQSLSALRAGRKLTRRRHDPPRPDTRHLDRAPVASHPYYEDQPMTTPRTQTVRILDLPLGPGGRTLRLIQHLDSSGEPEALSLALGFGGADRGDPFTRPAWGEPLLQLPPEAVEPLRDALTALLEVAR